MFAVPGWSVSNEILKTQDFSTSSRATNMPSIGKTEKTSKKRKRNAGYSDSVQITGDNLAELWEKHIEGKAGKSLISNDREGVDQQKKKKKRKNQSLRGGQEAEPLREQSRDIEQDEHQNRNEEAAKEPPVAFDGQENGKRPTEIVNPTAKAQDSKEVGKAGYDERMRKKHEKALLRASGELPPYRPAQPPKPTQSSQVSKRRKKSDSKLVPPEVQVTNGKTSAPLANIALETPSTESRSQDQVTEDEPKKPSSQSASQPTYSKSKANAKPQPKPPTSNPPPHEDPTLTTKSPFHSTTSFPIPPDPPPILPVSTKLTPLQAKMQSKLLSARFRHLNQTLYTTPSAQASTLFASQPSAYASYHAGFRAQVAVWPQNPVETFIADIKIRGAIKREALGAQKKVWRGEKKGKGKGKGKGKKGEMKGGSNEESKQDIESLPRTKGVCTIADLGCGDATLAGALTPSAGPKDLNLKMHSFDLAKGDGPNAGLVTVADVTALPLKEGAVDVAVLCLSLMGTNWVSCVDEVARVVRWGGEAWVAEIKSRFARAGRKREGGIGATKAEGGKAGRKRKKDDDDAGDDEKDGIDDIVEIDSDPDILAPGKGGKARRPAEDETDVGAFVEVWHRRGFELKGEVDLGNKMFVRMRFVKRGVAKGEEETGGRDRMKARMDGKTKFIEEVDDGNDGGDEAKVLKPCVYKLR